MDRAEPPPSMTIQVAYSPCTGVVDEVQLVVRGGSTVREALAMSEMLTRHAEIDLDNLRIGVWTKLRGLDDVLRDHDRVEIYRPLKVDPKEARRLRYRKHRDRVKS